MKGSIHKIEGCPYQTKGSTQKMEGRTFNKKGCPQNMGGNATKKFPEQDGGQYWQNERLWLQDRRAANKNEDGR